MHGKRAELVNVHSSWKKFLKAENFIIRAFGIKNKSLCDNPNMVIRQLRRLKPEYVNLNVDVPKPAPVPQIPTGLNSVHCTEYGVWSGRRRIA